MKKKKRNRGGQKGNQNAFIHGFYASILTPDETCYPLQIPGAITVIFTAPISLVFSPHVARLNLFYTRKGGNNCLLKICRTKPVGRSRRYFTEFFEANVSA
jgi:hypothetical protein